MEVTTKLGRDTTVITTFNNTVVPALSLLMARVIVDLDPETLGAFRRFVTRDQPTGYTKADNKFVDAIPEAFRKAPLDFTLIDVGISVDDLIVFRDELRFFATYNSKIDYDPVRKPGSKWKRRMDAPSMVEFRIHCVYDVREGVASVGPVKLRHWA